MSTKEKLIESYKKLPEEQKKIWLPTLEKLNNCANTKKELFESKQNFFIQFTGVVGVVFGVLAAFSNVGENKVADIIYFVGTFFCLVCLVLCIICLFQPTHRLQKIQAQEFDDLIKEFGKAATKLTGKQFDFHEDKVKSCPIFKILRKIAYVCFGISLVCLFGRHIVLLTSAYCS